MLACYSQPNMPSYPRIHDTSPDFKKQCRQQTDFSDERRPTETMPSWDTQKKPSETARFFFFDDPAMAQWPHDHDTFSSAWTRFQASARSDKTDIASLFVFAGKTQPRFLLESSCRTNWPFDIFRLLWLLGQTHRKLCFKVYFNSLTVFWRKCHHLWNRTLHILHPSSMFFPWKTLKNATISCCWTGKASLPRRRPAAAGHLSSAPTSRRPGVHSGSAKKLESF